jgi:hypothetical protein
MNLRPSEHAKAPVHTQRHAHTDQTDLRLSCRCRTKTETHYATKKPEDGIFMSKHVVLRAM